MSLVERCTFAVEGGEERGFLCLVKVFGMVVEMSEDASVRAEWRKVWRAGRSEGSVSRAGWGGREEKGGGERRMREEGMVGRWPLAGFLADRSKMAIVGF